MRHLSYSFLNFKKCFWKKMTVQHTEEVLGGLQFYFQRVFEKVVNKSLQSRKQMEVFGCEIRTERWFLKALPTKYLTMLLGFPRRWRSFIVIQVQMQIVRRSGVLLPIAFFNFDRIWQYRAACMVPPSKNSPHLPDRYWGAYCEIAAIKLWIAIM